MFIKNYLSRIVALVLVVVISLIGSSSALAAGLSGNYQEDTLSMVETLTKAIELPDDAPNKEEIQQALRQQINDYIARYRRNSKYSSLKSFTTMQTALNALAGYYGSYGNRPLPEKLKKRLEQEFRQVKIAVNRGI